MFNRKLALTLVACFISGTAYATPTVIDFEDLAVGSGGSSLEVTTVGNTVTFTTSTNALVAGTGGRPLEGFVVRNAPNDTPAGGNWGKRFLTDESALGGRLNGNGTYSMVFANAIFDLAVEAADYRRDGGGRVGDIISLTAFNSLGVEIAQDSYTVTRDLVDGYLHRFLVSSAAGDIYSAILRTSGRDVGTGIDNVAFTSVPEPGTLGLLGMGLIGLALARRKRSA